MAVELVQSDRFAKSWLRLGPQLTRKAYGNVHDLVRVAAAHPDTWLREYKPVEHLKEVESVRELRLAGGPRLLFHADGRRVTLLEAGKHEVTGRYSRAELATDLASPMPAPAAFYPGHKATLRFFGSNPDKASSTFGPELEPQWVTYLTAQQAAFAGKIVEAVRRTTENNPRFFFIVGGPGTGKTTMLLKLLLDVSAVAKPGLVIADPVAAQVEASGIRLAGSRMAPGEWANFAALKSTPTDKFDVLLVDDPSSVGQIEYALDSAIGVRRAVVVAFDPCQLDEMQDLTDELFDRLVASYQVKQVYKLRACYRQKETVGRATKRVVDQVAASTPFKWDQRIAWFKEGHARVYAMANEMTFPNKHGYEETYPEATLKDVRRELLRIRSRALWTHTPPVLLVVDQSADTSGWTWGELLGDIPYTKVDLYEGSHQALLRIKGVEFQHALIVIREHLFRELEEGFEAVGQAAYHRRRLLRIPFSRAKDSVVTFVRPSPDADVARPPTRPVLVRPDPQAVRASAAHPGSATPAR